MSMLPLRFWRNLVIFHCTCLSMHTFFSFLVGLYGLNKYMMVVEAFPSLARILGECSTIHSPPALFSFCFCFFEVEISSRTLIPLFRPGSVLSGSASWDDCGRKFPDKLRVSSFPDGFPHYAWAAAWSAHSDFVFFKGVYMFRCDLAPALLAEWPGYFTCHCSNRWVERTPK